MSLVPFPYDVVGAWTARHNIKLSKEAYEDLIEQFETFGRVDELLKKEYEHKMKELEAELRHQNAEQIIKMVNAGFYTPKEDITNVTKEL